LTIPACLAVASLILAATLKVANMLGLSIPPGVLAVVDEVME